MTKSLPTKEKRSKSYLLFGLGLIVAGSFLAYFIFTFRHNVGSMIFTRMNSPDTEDMNQVEVQNDGTQSPFENQSATSKIGGRGYDDLVPGFIDSTVVGTYGVEIQEIDFTNKTITLLFELDNSLPLVYGFDEIQVLRPIYGTVHNEYSTLGVDDIGRKADFIVTPSEKSLTLQISGDKVNE